MKYNFDYVNTKDPLFAVYDNIAYVSRAMLKTLGNPAQLNIGIDIANKVLGISIADKTKNRKIYSVKNCRIYCPKLIKVIKSLTQQTHFVGEYSKEDSIYLVYLNQQDTTQKEQALVSSGIN